MCTANAGGALKDRRQLMSPFIAANGGVAQSSKLVASWNCYIETSMHTTCHLKGHDCTECARLAIAFDSGDRRQWACITDVPEELRLKHQAKAPAPEAMQRSGEKTGRGGARAGAGRPSELEKAAKMCQPLNFKRARTGSLHSAPEEEEQLEEEEPEEQPEEQPEEEPEEEPMVEEPMVPPEEEPMVPPEEEPIGLVKTHSSAAADDDDVARSELAVLLSKQMSLTCGALESAFQSFFSKLESKVESERVEAIVAIEAARDEAGDKILELQRLLKAHKQIDVLRNEYSAVLPSSGNVRLVSYSVSYSNLR